MREKYTQGKDFYDPLATPTFICKMLGSWSLKGNLSLLGISSSPPSYDAARKDLEWKIVGEKVKMKQNVDVEYATKLERTP